MKKHNCKRRGFTLIELLVVISIIALLMAIMMPALAQVRKQAKAVVCQATLSQWGIIWSMYADDNGGKVFEGLSWVEPLFPYYKNPELLLCPMANTVDPQRRLTDRPDKVRGGKFAAWEESFTMIAAAESSFEIITAAGGSIPPPPETQEPVSRTFKGSYGLNFWFTESTGGDRDTIPDRNWQTIYVKGTAQVPLFTDSAVSGFAPLHWDSPPEWDGHIYEGDTDIHEIRSCCLNRHHEAINVLFVDSSVRKVGLKELWQLRWNRKWFINEHRFDDPYPPWRFRDPTHWMYSFRNYK